VLGALGWIADRLPSAEAPVFAFLLMGAGVILALPPAGAFLGALRFGRRGGVAGLVAAWIFALYVGGSMMAVFSGCRFDHRCEGAEVFTSLGEFARWAGVGVLATAPWQVAWIAVAAACLYGGLRVRRRKLAAA
jgi:uncharacterized membrane protein